MFKKTTLALLIMLAVLTQVNAAIDKLSVGGTYGIETITRSDTSVEDKITSVGIVVHGSSYLTPMSNIGGKCWLGMRKPLTWTKGDNTLDVTDVPMYVEAGAAVAYQVPVTNDFFLETGVGFQYSTQSYSISSIIIRFGAVYVNAFIELNYAIQSSVFLSAGLMAGYQLGAIGDIMIDGNQWSKSDDDLGVYIAPYAAVSFAY